MWDERGPQATVKGGYMSPYSGTQFAIYRPAGYTPLSGESRYLIGKWVLWWWMIDG